MLPFNNPRGIRFPPNMIYGGHPLMMPNAVAPGLLPPAPQVMLPSMAPAPPMPTPFQVGIPRPAPPYRPMLIGPGVMPSSSSTPQAPQQQESPPSNVAHGWTEHTSTDGSKYYCNRAKNISSWTKPDCLKTPEEREKSVWREYKAPDGRSYYHNKATKATTWTRPAVLGKADEGASEGRKKQQAVEEPAGDSELERAMAATMRKLEAEATAEESQLAKKQPEQTPKQRQVEKFRELLKDKYSDGRITTAMTWEQACKLLQNDQRFKGLPKISEKKQAFNAWKIQRAKEEKDEKRLAIKKAKEDLEKWLMTNPKMSTTMSYGKAATLFEKDTLWKAVDEMERREIYRDVQATLKKRQDEAAVALRERNNKVLADILDSIEEVNHRTTWAQAQRILIENESFATDATLQGMDKEDALIIFQQHIRDAEKHYEGEKQLEAKRVRRQERKIREAFVQFLRELHAKGSLNSTSTWSSLYPTLSCDDRFEAMLMQTGSTALDLFKFFVEDLKEHYYEDRKTIKEILKDLNINVSATTRLEELQERVKSDERGSKVDMGNLKLCWSSLVDKAQAKEKELEREQTRKVKRQESAFHALISALEPPAEPTSQWAEVRSRLEHMDGFEAVENEEQRESFFKSYLKKISEACGHHHPKHKKKRKQEAGNEVGSTSEESPSKRKRTKQSRDPTEEGMGDAAEIGSGSKHKKTKKHRRHEVGEQGDAERSETRGKHKKSKHHGATEDNVDAKE